MFANHHIDTTPRFGKRNGAFLQARITANPLSFYDNFNGTLNDVFTLAHEPDMQPRLPCIAQSNHPNMISINSGRDSIHIRRASAH